ncbi:30S ribosomal protein S8 [Candidatus Roizmanbacteria bacterium]|nr:MAG: 30S ribosomal protein S8 [Candidatus Roizmanbacteria bacterium]
MLRYKHGEAVFTNVTIRSKPGRRWYITVNDIKPVMSGTGYMIISTSRGLMTNVEARKSKLGGSYYLRFGSSINSL